jgi:hypothetical protein
MRLLLTPRPPTRLLQDGAPDGEGAPRPAHQHHAYSWLVLGERYRRLKAERDSLLLERNAAVGKAKRSARQYEEAAQILEGAMESTSTCKVRQRFNACACSTHEPASADGSSMRCTCIKHAVSMPVQVSLLVTRDANSRLGACVPADATAVTS